MIIGRKWYLDECYRQLNNPTFYEQQDTDLTDTIQKRVTEYVKRMLNDELIDKNHKQYLLQKDPKPEHFYILPKIHKVNNPGRPIVSSNNHPTECIHNLLIFISNPWSALYPHTSKIPLIFLTNSPPLTIFLLMPCLSRLMSRHCILTSHMMKELMLVVFSFENALINIFLRKPFATSVE